MGGTEAQAGSRVDDRQSSEVKVCYRNITELRSAGRDVPAAT